MGTIKNSLSALLIAGLVALAGTNAGAQDNQTKVKNGENKELKVGADAKKEKKRLRAEAKQKKVAEAKQKKEAEAKVKKEAKEKKAKAEAEKKGNAYGKDKGELEGKEFGQARGNDAKAKAEKTHADADEAANEAKKADKPAKEKKAKK